MTEEEKRAAEEAAKKAAEEAKVKAEAEAAAKAAANQTPPPVPPSVTIPAAPAEVLESPQAKRERLLKEAEDRAKKAEEALAAQKAREAEKETELARLTRLVEAQAKAQQEAEQRLYVDQMKTYRASVIAAYGGRIIEGMVPPVLPTSVPTPEAIVSAAKDANAEYERLFKSFADSNLSKKTDGPAAPQTVQVVPTPVVQAPPPGAMPSPPPEVGPAASATQTQNQDVSQYTSPEAIRSGLYAQNRAAILAGIQGKSVPMQPPPMTAQTSRPPAIVQTQDAGGAQRPVAAPTPPAINPNVPVPPPPAAVNLAVGQSNAALSEAQAAVLRARQGQLPANVANDPKNKGVTAYANAHLKAQADGDAQAAFASRFSS